MSFSTIMAWALVLQLSAIATFLIGYCVVLYKKEFTPGSAVWFAMAALFHVFLWFQYSGQANRDLLKQGAYSDLWVGISIEHQAAAASILVAVGYLFCVISGAIAALLVHAANTEPS